MLVRDRKRKKHLHAVSLITKWRCVSRPHTIYSSLQCLGFVGFFFRNYYYFFTSAYFKLAASHLARFPFVEAQICFRLWGSLWNSGRHENVFAISHNQGTLPLFCLYDLIYVSLSYYTPPFCLCPVHPFVCLLVTPIVLTWLIFFSIINPNFLLFFWKTFLVFSKTDRQIDRQIDSLFPSSGGNPGQNGLKWHHAFLS